MSNDTKDLVMTVVDLNCEEGKDQRCSEMNATSLVAASSKTDPSKAAKLARGYEESDGQGLTTGGDMEAQKRKNKRSSREVILLVCLVVLFLVTIFSCSWVVIVLTRETRVDENHEMVDANDGEPISVHEARYTGSILALPALDARQLASVESLSFTAFDSTDEIQSYDVTFFVTSTVKHIVDGETVLTVRGSGQKVVIAENLAAVYTSSNVDDPCSSAECVVVAHSPEDVSERRRLQIPTDEVLMEINFDDCNAIHDGSFWGQLAVFQCISDVYEAARSGCSSGAIQLWPRGPDVFYTCNLQGGVDGGEVAQRAFN